MGDRYELKEKRWRKRKCLVGVEKRRQQNIVV